MSRLCMLCCVIGRGREGGREGERYDRGRGRREGGEREREGGRKGRGGDYQNVFSCLLFLLTINSTIYFLV